MSWPSQQVEANNSTKQRSKVRKRGCSSSTSSSSFRKYRFKRAIVIAKRGGGSSTTPVPTWRSNRSPSLLMQQAAELSRCSPSKQSGGKPNKEKASVSARKLAASLWEINKFPEARLRKDHPLQEIAGDIDNNTDSHRKKKKKKKEQRSRERVAKLCRAGYLPSHLSDPSYNPVSESMDKVRRAIHGSMLEIEKCSPGEYRNGYAIGLKAHLKDLRNGLMTSKELLKALNHVCGLEEKHTSSIAIVSALRVELDRARLEVDQLICEQRSNQNEIEYLMKHFAEEKAAWKSRERERIRTAISGMAEQLEVEKKLRRQTERLNKKLGNELADTKEHLSKALQELESEKRAKEILEQVCDELAKGIGEDRAEVEELKRESAKVREEVEKEREMLQLADVLREERVQMKLSEAKYHFEEKNAAVERLKHELESYLRTKNDSENVDRSPNFKRIQELEAYLKEIDFGSCQKAEKNEDSGAAADNEEQEGDDSADSDLHSIELNMDDISRSYKWSYACENGAADDSKRGSVDRGLKERKSFSEKIQWENICLERGTSNGMNCISGKHNQEHSEVMNRERSDDLLLQEQMQDYEDEIQRYLSVKSLRDRILSGSKLAFASPTRQWGDSLPFQDSENGVQESISPVLQLQGKDLKSKLLGTRSKARISTSSK